MRLINVHSPPVILDGGVATELEARGNELRDELWSARLLNDAPEEITAAHAAFLRSGASVLTTASYQASIRGFAARGIGRDQGEKLLRRSVALARAACARVADRTCLVAASVGPYGAVLSDGSEYRGRYGLSRSELIDFHRPRIRVLAEAAPDLFALETVPDIDEARALVDAVAGFGIPAWLSYTISGDRTRAGQPLDEAFDVAANSGDVIAVGVNCCTPEDADHAVETAHRVSGKPVVVYPNSGEGWDPRRGWVGSGSFSADRALRWYADGARIIGGCCRVGPADIAEIAGLFGA